MDDTREATGMGEDTEPRPRWWRARAWMVPVPAVLFSAAAIAVLLNATCGAQ